jgi:DsbE subfamily thiol:disulfide oxidoreductase
MTTAMPPRRFRSHATRLGAALTAIVACVTVASCTAKGDAATALKAPAIGAPAPVYAAHDLDDKPTSLAALRGKVVVLNLWATWCLPCREELPQLVALHKEFAGQGVELVGVSVDAAGMGLDVRDFMKEHDMTYPVWLDPEHQFALKFLTVGVPETFVVDRAGIIRYRKIGSLVRGDTTLASAIRSALGAS